MLAEWEDPQAEAGVLAVDASTGAVLWTVTVPREQHDSIDLFASDGVAIHTRHRGTITALDAGDGRTLWRTSGESLRFVSMRAGIVVTGNDSSVIGRSVRDGRVVFRWNARAMPIAFVAPDDAIVLTLTSEVGGGPVGTVHAIERSSGAVRWATPVGSASAVVTGGDHAFVLLLNCPRHSFRTVPARVRTMPQQLDGEVSAKNERVARHDPTRYFSKCRA